MFCSSLEAAGAEVIDVVDPSRRLPRVDVLHIHWPDRNFWVAWSRRNELKRCVLTLIQIARAKLGGMKVVWMVHDLRPLHQEIHKGLIWNPYIRSLSLLVDGFMTLSEDTLAPVRVAYPALAKRPFAAANHPLYPAPSGAIDRVMARQALELPDAATVFTFFGVIRPPKGVLSLAQAFAALPGDQYRLIIAGDPLDLEYMEQVRLVLAGDPRVTLKAGYIDEADASLIAAATDAFVLPFAETLHSSSIIFGLSSGHPVITPNQPYARGVSRAVGPGWITRYEGALTPEILQAWRPPTEAARLEAFALSGLGEASMALYKRLIEQPDLERQSGDRQSP